MRTAILFLALLSPAGMAAAQDTGFTYEQFEVSVPHLDLESCPPDMPQENVFCRAAILHDALHVYAFRDDGSAEYVAMKTYHEGAYRIVFD